MANTYTQIYIQVVFAVKGRENLILKKWEVELYKYITGIVREKNQKLYIINGMPDHVHILLSLAPSIKISDLVRDIKANSSSWINKRKLVQGKFQWQVGFGAFSYGQSQLPRVINYIKNQKEHHGKRTFQEEYKEFLENFEVEYDDQYLFEYYA
ncbi:MAG: IS200/IS605 family transposase [Flavobacteriales bacterium]|nr:IS200/IS605 family transposase [Flavobacteriales bacterium]